MKKKGFTLVELLAVIVILGIILLIAVPKVISTINSSKLATLDDTVKMIAKTAEREYVTRTTLNTLDQVGDPITCDDVVNLSSNDYSNCEISFSGDVAYISLIGKGNFAGLSCTDGTKDDPNCGITIESVDASGANPPVLYSNMIPVKYSSGNWIYADTNQKWYDYDLKEWANSIVLKKSPSKTYSVGDTISMNDIAMMYVWIPRYKYTIFNGNNGEVNEQKINIIFENGTSSTGTVSCADNISTSGSSSENCTDTINGSIINGTSTYTHPAFKFGSTNLTGFWVGKFEVSTDPVSECYTLDTGQKCGFYSSTLFVKPDAKSWRYSYVRFIHDTITAIASDYNIDANVHIIKNMDWGAITYLTYSKYGICNEEVCTNLWINPSNSYLTGQAGNSPSVVSSSTTYSYNTSYGVNASTTKNVYGVYDMAGGSEEIVMGNMVDADGNFYSSEGEFETPPNEKYYDKYTYDGDTQTSLSRSKLGDAIKEIIKQNNITDGGWNDNTIEMSYIHCSWFVRGGAKDSTNSGIFNSKYFAGASSTDDSTRPVITSN